MKGADLKAFRKINGLTQSDLGDFWGVKKAFVSQMESDKCPISKDKFIKLLNNPYGWDTSMLDPDEKFKLIDVSELLPGLKAHSENTSERVKSAILDALGVTTEEFLVSYLQEKIADQDRLIRELYKEIGMLEAKLELARKGETASGAAGSSCADVG